jgi:mono/diheme cytochrome c family protein
MPVKLIAFLVVAVFALAACGGGGGNASTSSSTTSSGGTTSTAAGGSGADGAKLFVSNGCSGCHTLKAAGSNASTGPDLDTQLPKDASKAGQDLKAFTKESIVKPSAFIAEGFSDGIMPSTFGSSLKPAEIDALVAYVTGGK